MTGPHGVLCACDACWTAVDFDDDFFAKAIERAAEVDQISDCD